MFSGKRYLVVPRALSPFQGRLLVNGQWSLSGLQKCMQSNASIKLEYKLLSFD